MDFMDFSRRLYRWASEGVDMYHRRIQDFVRRGPHYLGEQYFVGRGGQGPLAPPPPGSAHVYESESILLSFRCNLSRQHAAVTTGSRRFGP